MLTRVCPVCDKKMKYAHFCANCRIYVKEPFLWERNYVLNGDGDSAAAANQCKSHDHSQENATGKVKNYYNKPAMGQAGKQQAKKQKAYEAPAYRQPARKPPNQAANPAKGKRSILGIILIIYVLIQFLGIIYAFLTF